MRKLTSIVAAAISLAVLAGCAGPQTSNVSVPKPSPTDSGIPSQSPTPKSELPGSIVLGGDHWEIRDTDGATTSSLSYTEPVATALQRLTAVLGSNYTRTEYLAGDGCGQEPAHIYSWANGDFDLTDSTGLTTEPPRDVVPYWLSAYAREVSGVEIVTTGNLSVGDDASALPGADDPNNVSGFLLLEKGGSYERTVGSDGTKVQNDWGLLSVSGTNPHSVDSFSAPVTGREFFC